jgi:predicted amidohydrolase
MIPKNIKREHVIEAISYIDSYGTPNRRKPTGYILAFEGKEYPPKYLISLANKFANGTELGSSEFSGGKETILFLSKLGFNVVERPRGRNNRVLPIAEKRERGESKSHNESCPKCKETIRKFLEKIYGKVEENYRFSIGTRPEDFSHTPYHAQLQGIYRALQDHRGFKNFVKVRNLPSCDFFVPNPGFIVEFDEAQHFTRPREITLMNYPASLRLGFERDAWSVRCSKLNKRDNNPYYRDEQRAWYDTLRDFSSNALGISIVRLSPKEHVWCGLRANNENDVAWFRGFIQNKLESPSGEYEIRKEGESLKVGLVFPELIKHNLDHPERRKHNLDHFLTILNNAKGDLNLLVFPEAFECIEAENSIGLEQVAKQKSYLEIENKYAEISKKYSISIIVGVGIDHKDASISGGRNDHYCLFINPKGKRALYHKHSSSKYKAFFDDDWSIDNNFPILEVAHKKVGISICHDSYISLIPRILKTKGADIWVNISFQNVRTHVWEAILQTRAVENGMICLCTLHRNSKPGKGRPQKEPYAFSETGKIRLKELLEDKFIDKILPEKRAGKIYYFSTLGYETSALEGIEESDLARKADVISVIKSPGGNFAVEGGKDEYVFEHITINEFVFLPERLWQLSLKERDKITLFIVRAKNREEWNENRSKVERIIKGRIIEFSTLFVFMDQEREDLLMAAYR